MCPPVCIRAALLGEGRVWGTWDQELGSVADLCPVSCKHSANVAFGMLNNGHKVLLKPSVVSKFSGARKVMVMNRVC